MTSYIFTKHKGIHILNLTQTTCFLSKACDLLANVASGGKKI
jgi:ribosomal protein S2